MRKHFNEACLLNQKNEAQLKMWYLESPHIKIYRISLNN